jgi:predicted dehydrogenase
MSTETIGVAVIGFGFMGRTHAAAYERARLAGAPCALRAICTTGTHPSAVRTDAVGQPLPFDLDALPYQPDIDRILEDEDIHAVSICTYTDTHVDLSVRALAAGKHVLIEKPVALTVQAMEPLARAAQQADTLCMPALCMRYWPGWPWLRDRIHENTYGGVRRAEFVRMTKTPDWATFYADTHRSGGALHDLHIHDADFVRWCFGMPRSVFAEGSLHGISTAYELGHREMTVHADAAWVDQPDFPFRMTYHVEFERATATFDVSRTPTVLIRSRGGTDETVDLPAESAYDAQVRDFIDAIASGQRSTRCTLDDAVAVTRILEAEQESTRTGSCVPLAFHTVT